MPLIDIEQLLHDTIGLNVSSIGSSAVMRAVDYRMSDCSISDIEKYKQKLIADKNELQELVEEVVVSETWFFRDTRPFKMLARFVKEEWLPSAPDRSLKILSLPCATGEEPYSIAITLIEAGLVPSQLKIDAFDISERNISRCKIASYSNNSFRSVDPAIQNRFFTRRENGYFLDILIKAMVNFDKASMLDPGFIHTRPSYDIVFCRNLLIYFDRNTQAFAMNVLDKLLKPTGLLFVGHAETGIFIDKWYVSQRYPKSFIIRKAIDDPAMQNKSRRRRTATGIKPKISTAAKRQRRVRAVTGPTARITRTPEAIAPAEFKEKVSGKELEIARQLADTGKLTKAEAICIQCLEANKQDAETYHLLALIQLATGDVQKAAQYFKNVVYLEPIHYDALMYLSTLMGEQGDEKAASRYRERAQRIKNRIEPKRTSI
ncbi:MAG: CheR family methyltransferase [Gammaproteobacteria bacterium]